MTTKTLPKRWQHLFRGRTDDNRGWAAIRVICEELELPRVPTVPEMLAPLYEDPDAWFRLVGWGGWLDGFRLSLRFPEGATDDEPHVWIYQDANGWSGIHVERGAGVPSSILGISLRDEERMEPDPVFADGWGQVYRNAWPDLQPMMPGLARANERLDGLLTRLFRRYWSFRFALDAYSRDARKVRQRDDAAWEDIG